MKRTTAVRVICIVLALIFVLSLLTVIIPARANAVSQSEINALQAKRDQIRAQQVEQQNQIDGLRNEKAGVLEQKAALDQEANLTQEEINVVQEQIELYADLIVEKKAELEQARAEEAKQSELFRARMREMEEGGKLSFIVVLLESRSISDLLTRIDMISEVMSYDKALEKALMDARAKVEEAEKALEDAKAEQEAKKGELEARKADLLAQVAEAEALVKSLENDIEAYKAAYNETEAAKQALQREIDAKVAQMEAERRAAEEAARKAAEEAARQQAQQQQQQQQQTSQPTQPTTPTYTTGTGSMVWPCPSCHTITSEFGWRIHPIYGTSKYHSGVDIGASYGATVIAADSGTVITAGWVSGYGNCIVISHGNGISTLYGHLSSIAVSSGQSVSRGQTIGYVGSTGNSTGPHLHWEVTVNGERQNPLNYAS
ncbi:MAG: peptidoglycan DD-metalloendopeptidase family protein [Oscillospiraceae bacterium]|nr:peptidoglycan DD-metalloendopeptidase family protein [Oscillospiraceae bacterium]MBQ6404273.1 peptidoglycan DD-metalloendopeptidase family protein [Oscillospiraceae bacterium]